MIILNHRVKDAPYVPTKKRGGIITPRGILLHYTASYNTAGDIQTLARDLHVKASAHGVLARDGSWTQIVPFNVKAWHAGPSEWPLDVAKPRFKNLNDTFIGLEVTNVGWLRKLSNGNFIDQYSQQIKPNGQFVGKTRRTPKESPPPGEWPEFDHPNLGKGVYVWEPYTEAQVTKLLELCAALIKKYPTITHILRHEDVDTRGWKTDTGPMLDTRPFQRLLEKRGEPDPTPVPTPAPALPAPVAMTEDEARMRVLAKREEAARARMEERPWYQRWDNIWRWTRG